MHSLYIKNVQIYLKNPNPIENTAAIINNMPIKQVRAEVFLCLYALSFTEASTGYRPNLKSM